MLRNFMAATIAAAVFVLIPHPASAQSLGEAAAKERAKKEKEKKPPATKVITNDDLRHAKGTVTVMQAPPAGEEGAKPVETKPVEGAAKAKPEPTEDEKRAAAEKEWREKLTAAQADVARLKAQADEILTSMNDPNLSFYGTGRQQLANKLDDVKKQLVTAQQTVDDLEETGRKARYRP